MPSCMYVTTEGVESQVVSDHPCLLAGITLMEGTLGGNQYTIYDDDAAASHVAFVLYTRNVGHLINIKFPCPVRFNRGIILETVETTFSATLILA